MAWPVAFGVRSLLLAYLGNGLAEIPEKVSDSRIVTSRANRLSSAPEKLPGRRNQLHFDSDNCWAKEIRAPAFCLDEQHDVGRRRAASKARGSFEILSYLSSSLIVAADEDLLCPKACW